MVSSGWKFGVCDDEYFSITTLGRKELNERK